MIGFPYHFFFECLALRYIKKKSASNIRPIGHYKEKLFDELEGGSAHLVTEILPYENHSHSVQFTVTQ